MSNRQAVSGGLAEVQRVASAMRHMQNAGSPLNCPLAAAGVVGDLSCAMTSQPWRRDARGPSRRSRKRESSVLVPVPPLEVTRP
eukprot:2288512-Pyramimonas_sp.AAC.1